MFLAWADSSLLYWGPPRTSVFERKGARQTQRRKKEREEGMNENEIARIVVDAAIEVHRTLGGPGLLERSEERRVGKECRSRWLVEHRQKIVPLMYKGKRLGSDLRLDLLVNDRVIVGCKAAIGYN